MTAARTVLMVTTPLLLGGCSTVFWGNVGVLAVTVGIFVSTVFLTRSESSSSASRSSASTTQR